MNSDLIVAQLCIESGCDSTLSGFLTRKLREGVSPGQFKEHCKRFVAKYEEHMERNGRLMKSFPTTLLCLVYTDDLDEILPKFYEKASTGGADHFVAFFDGEDTKDIVATRGQVGKKAIEKLV